MKPNNAESAVNFLAGVLDRVAENAKDGMVENYDLVTEEALPPVELSDVSTAVNELRLTLDGNVYVFTARRQS